MCLALVPAVRLLRLDARALALWRGTGEETTAPEIGGVAVWRKQFSVYHRSLRQDEERCLHALASGATLAGLGEIVAEEQPSAAGERLAALLALWTDEELLRSTA